MSERVCVLSAALLPFSQTALRRGHAILKYTIKDAFVQFQLNHLFRSPRTPAGESRDAVIGGKPTF